MKDRAGIEFPEVELIPVVSDDDIRLRQDRMQLDREVPIILRLPRINCPSMYFLFSKPFPRGG